ncbi:MAG TPA: hypothetical protein VMU09_12180 [Acidimicrobiales bacterium]|nr:hypothetical protein [Acidimicrobiales bacterium]
MVIADRGSGAPGTPAGADARAQQGVEGNARLTGSLAAVIFVLLAAEGLTIVGVRRLLTPHVFIGMLLVPPVLAKIASTGYRFSRYYLGAPAYRRKGPPGLVMRLLGPIVVVLTIVVLASGVALLYVSPGSRSTLLFLHKASFVLWFGAMAIHVLGHLLDTTRLAPADWARRTRRQVAGAGLRQWTVAACLVAGVLLGAAVVGQVGPWLSSSPRHLGN